MLRDDTADKLVIASIADATSSRIVSRYDFHFSDASIETYNEELYFPDASPDAWAKISKETLDAFSQAISLADGAEYWKLHTPRHIELAGFTLTEKQARFWEEVYTKGLGEFFYRTSMDPRGRISFPHARVERGAPQESLRAGRVLLAQGGGKDSIVSAEVLKRLGVPFDTFVAGKTVIQDLVVKKIGRRNISALRRRDPVLDVARAEKRYVPGIPGAARGMIVGSFAAVLHGYSYIVYSNEYSAEFGNAQFLGMDINHAWGKTIECELLVRNYLSEFVTKEVTPFSLIHQYSQAFMVREFSRYPQYFDVFSSCNSNFQFTPDLGGKDERPRWCCACAKCVFIFACLSAFISRDQLLGIFGKNLYQDRRLLPIFGGLLGLYGTKPLDCVGTPEEMIVVMAHARNRKEYARTPAMDLFESILLKDALPVAELEAEVFAVHGKGTIPSDFRKRYLPATAIL